MSWYDDGGNAAPHEPPRSSTWTDATARCARCGQPVAGSVEPEVGRVYHGECYAELVAARNADQDAERARLGLPIVGGIGATSHDERVRDGVERG